MKPFRLYERLLGTAWGLVHESVRKVHLNGDNLRAAGSFRILHGSQPAARWLARLILLPPAGDAVPVRLKVTRSGDGEKWSRWFANKPLRSTQCEREGLLAEIFGLLEFRFKLVACEGAILYEQHSVGMRLGNFLLPIPRPLAPQVRACEQAGSSLDRTFIQVELFMPLIGSLIQYGGELEVEVP